MGQLLCNKEDIKLGVMLNCAPNIGGSFQYAQSLLEALYHFDRARYQVVAFYQITEWADYLRERYPNIVSRQVSRNYVLAGQQIDAEECALVIVAAQEDLSGCIKTPFVVPIHDLMHRYESTFPEVSAAGEASRRDYMYHNIMEHAAGVLVDSAVGKQQVMDSYGSLHEQKIHILPFTVPEYIYETNVQGVQLPFDKYIFYPAQFWQHKNHLNLIRAIAQLKREGVVVNAVFVGYPYNGYDQVLQEIRRLQLESQIKILGYVSSASMSGLYKGARAMIMTTFFGPTNIPPLEAMTLGCPVGVSGIYGMPEQLGDGALYFNPQKVSEIAKVIKRYWLDDGLCEQMRNIGKQRAKLYTPAKFGERLLGIIEQIFTEKESKYSVLQRLQSFIGIYQHCYIYGAGLLMTMLYQNLRSMPVVIDGFIVTTAHDNAASYQGKPIMALNDVALPEKTGIIIAMMDKHQDEVKHSLQQHGIENGCILCMSEQEIWHLLVRDF